MLSESLEAQARREEREPLFPACHKPKQPGKAFCQKCYFSLPKDLQMDLARERGVDWAVVYDEAKDWLRINARKA